MADSEVTKQLVMPNYILFTSTNSVHNEQKFDNLHHTKVIKLIRSFERC